MRIRSTLIPIACLAVLATCLATQTRAPGTTAAAPGIPTQAAAPDPRAELLDALAEIINVRTAQLQQIQAAVKDGRASPPDADDAECNLLNARIRDDLARDNRPAAIEHAERIVEIRTGTLDSMQKNAARLAPGDIFQARLDLAEARVQLAELQLH